MSVKCFYFFSLLLLELSVLLKQEFDAKNEELNQTLAETMSIGLGGDLMGRRVTTTTTSTSTTTMAPIQLSKHPLMNVLPPYQLPQSPNDSFKPPNIEDQYHHQMTASNNYHMKEGVHYRPVLFISTSSSSTTTTTTTTLAEAAEEEERTNERTNNTK